ncbi:hypothetical protein GWK47_023471 [Chionoecetes opilio]|uniref:Uncharacterized protein n=1 Tax=Chionoecetes opilio TaxID=41210 RepID=A0A8J4XLS4_CHIOP|nr:hypothetical protein GWK47_023471 [Chionoecetes opilio]
MKLHDNKFQSLRVGAQQNDQNPTPFLASEGREITSSTNVKCLGVHLSDDATFRHNIEKTILENLVPNPTAISDLSAQHINPRTGRKARRTLPSDAPARIKTLLSTSLPHIGPKLFNNLPGKLRNLTECSVEKFKHHLDNHLQTIPDEPPVPGYTSVSRADTNSISDQVNLQHRDAGFGCSGGAPRL